MKRIGICTLYYNNNNYGAILQAYSLVNILQKMGYEAELISYYDHPKMVRILSNIRKEVRSIKNGCNFAMREDTIRNFKSSIPSSKLYYPNTIKKTNAFYDCFITGSDQVWNPSWINNFFSLEFVDDSKKTVAYAASTGKIKLNFEQQEKLKKALDNTDFISVREKESIPSLQSLTTKEIKYVLDPTLLIPWEEWTKVCSKRRINENYMFCYFLGGDNHLREVAKEYARKRKLKIASLPNMNGYYRKVDEGFGEYPLYDVSPLDFLSLIKYSSFVMTDSFHATIFSHIFRRPFICSGGGKDEMGCRMRSVTKLFGTEEHYIEEHWMVSEKELFDLEKFDGKIGLNDYKRMKEESLAFLSQALSV